MHIVRVFEELDGRQTQLPSIFLAGPTPRDQTVLSWRPQALSLLEANGFQGVALVPETNQGLWREKYKQQTKWEKRHLGFATVILFWVPRNLVNMLGLTTNIEWGRWTIIKSDRIVLGFPPGTPAMGYFEDDAKDYHIPMFSTLEETVQAAILLAQKST